MQDPTVGVLAMRVAVRRCRGKQPWHHETQALADQILEAQRWAIDATARDLLLGTRIDAVALDQVWLPGSAGDTRIPGAP